MSDEHSGITVGELIEHLRRHNPDHYLTMNGLHFYRLKQRGPDLVQLEFDEQVYRDHAGNLIAMDLLTPGERAGTSHNFT